MGERKDQYAADLPKKKDSPTSPPTANCWSATRCCCYHHSESFRCRCSRSRSWMWLFSSAVSRGVHWPGNMLSLHCKFKLEVFVVTLATCWLSTAWRLAPCWNRNSTHTSAPLAQALWSAVESWSAELAQLTSAPCATHQRMRCRSPAPAASCSTRDTEASTPPSLSGWEPLLWPLCNSSSVV